MVNDEGYVTPQESDETKNGEGREKWRKRETETNGHLRSNEIRPIHQAWQTSATRRTSEEECQQWYVCRGSDATSDLLYRCLPLKQAEVM